MLSTADENRALRPLIQGFLKFRRDRKTPQPYQDFMSRDGRGARIDVQAPDQVPDIRIPPVIQTAIFVVTVLRSPDPIDVAAALVQHWAILMIYITAYLSTLVVFVLVDMAWLGTMASRLYRPTLGDIMLATVNLPAGIAFYLIYPVGLVYFAILPALKSGSLAQAVL
ncbi:MAG: DUF2177 family protein, partial [Bradyrhizobium sp.]|nr:DUF2177 family protein [Bradyrhizobium sp.]